MTVLALPRRPIPGAGCRNESRPAPSSPPRSRTAGERCPRPPVGVSTPPFLPRFLPCPPWWLDPLLGALSGSPAHPAAPGPPPGRGFPGPRVHGFRSGQGRRDPSWACDAHGDALRVEVVGEGSRGLRDPQGSLQSLQSPCGLAPAQPPHFPDSAGGGAPFTIKALPGAPAAAGARSGGPGAGEPSGSQGARRRACAHCLDPTSSLCGGSASPRQFGGGGAAEGLQTPRKTSLFLTGISSP